MTRGIKRQASQAADGPRSPRTAVGRGAQGSACPPRPARLVAVPGASRYTTVGGVRVASSRARRGGKVASLPSVGALSALLPRKYWSARHRGKRTSSRAIGKLGIQASAADAGEPPSTAGDMVGRLADQGVALVLAVDSPRDGRDDSGYDPAEEHGASHGDHTIGHDTLPQFRPAGTRSTRPATCPGPIGRSPGLMPLGHGVPSVRDMYLLSDTYR